MKIRGMESLIYRAVFNGCVGHGVSGLIADSEALKCVEEFKGMISHRNRFSLVGYHIIMGYERQKRAGVKLNE